MALLVALAAVGCQPAPAMSPSAAGGRGGAAAARGGSPQAVAQTEVVGTLRVPSHLINLDGGSLIAAGGLNYRLRQVASGPVRGARVFLADAAGQPSPQLAATTTDAEGRFRVPNVLPAAYVVVVEVKTQDGKTARFRTLVKVLATGATVQVDAASTLVALNVLEGEAGKDLSSINPATYQAAVDATARSLTREALPDFTDLASVRRAMNRLVEQVAELKDILGLVRKDLSEIKEQLARLNAALAARESGATASPASAAPTATPPSPASPAATGPGPSPSAAPAPAAGSYAVTTLAGSGAPGAQDGTGPEATFNSPQAIILSPFGGVLVADAGNRRIRQVSSQGAVSELVGTAALPLGPQGLARDKKSRLFVVDGKGLKVGQIGVGADNVPYASVPRDYGYDVYDRESGGAMGYPLPNAHAVAVTPDGKTLHVAAQDKHTVYRWVEGEDGFPPFAGTAFEAGSRDGEGELARLNAPQGLAVDSSGTLYVADTGNHLIRKVTPDGRVTTLAGSTKGFADGQGGAARFNAPEALTVDAQRNVWVADTENHRIRRITPDGAVTTVAGSGEKGFAEGIGAAAQFYRPRGIAVDGDGTVYVADSVNHRIRKLSPQP